MILRHQIRSCHRPEKTKDRARWVCRHVQRYLRFPSPKNNSMNREGFKGLLTYMKNSRKCLAQNSGGGAAKFTSRSLKKEGKPKTAGI